MKRGFGVSLILCSWMVLSSPALAFQQADFSTRVSGFENTFEEDDDRNYDGWPDEWRRRTGPNFPHYVKIAIVERGDGLEDDQRCLRIERDGGAAEAISPLRPISSHYSYVLEAELRVQPSASNERNDAWVSVQFLDADGHIVKVFESRRIRNNGRFETVRVGPMMPSEFDGDSVRVHLNFAATRSVDLFGTADFDNISLKPFPKLITSTNQPYNLFSESGEVQIECRVSGVQHPDAELELQLYDALWEPVGDVERRPISAPSALVESPMPEALNLVSRPGLGEVGPVSDDGQLGKEVTVTWHPPIQRRGFYRAQIRLTGGGEELMSRELTLAVIGSDATVVDQQFGWTLPGVPPETSLPELVKLLQQAGVHWVKYPVWYERGDDRRAEWIAEFAERLAAENMELVGVLDQPPESEAEAFDRVERGIAAIIQEPELWRPAIEHLLSRLTLKIHWWQLGSDEDLSLVGYSDLLEKLQEVRDNFDRYSRDSRIGITWHWLYESPGDAPLPWNFRYNTISPSMTADELGNYLQEYGGPGTGVWTTISPLSSSEYALVSRVRDLISKVIEVKITNAEAAFISEPFSDDLGLMNTDGTPGELFIPWRTTTVELANHEYLGQLRLPHGSPNYVFAEGDDAKMVLWNDDPTEETLYLGEDVVVTDIWGQQTQPEVVDGKQVIVVGPWPIIVSGVDAKVARFRMSFRFERDTLASFFGTRQIGALSFDNVFPRGATGTITLHSENLWSRPITMNFKLTSEENFVQEFPIVLKSLASTGRHPVRVDFVIDADQRYRFSVFRDIQVGFGLIEIELHSELLEGDVAQIHVTLINNSDESVNFNCMLLVPAQQRQRKQFLNLGRGRMTQTFFVPRMSTLFGRSLWIRAEEIRGNRVLNHQFTVEAPASLQSTEAEAEAEAESATPEDPTADPLADPAAQSEPEPQSTPQR